MTFACVILSHEPRTESLSETTITFSLQKCFFCINQTLCVEFVGIFSNRFRSPCQFEEARQAQACVTCRGEVFAECAKAVAVLNTSRRGRERTSRDDLVQPRVVPASARADLRHAVAGELVPVGCAQLSVLSCSAQQTVLCRPPSD